METSMGAKDVVRALLDRLPDDCTIVDVIDAILTIDDASLDETALPPLTQAQRDELDRRLDALERDAEPGTPWREALQEIRLDRDGRRPPHGGGAERPRGSHGLVRRA